MVRKMNSGINTPVRFVISSSDDLKRAVLCCPECGCEFVHHAGIEVYQGHIATYIGRNETRVEESDRHETESGSLTVQRFYCEEGHQFQYELSFSHGAMTLKLRVNEYDPGSERPSELWRD